MRKRGDRILKGVAEAADAAASIMAKIGEPLTVRQMERLLEIPAPALDAALRSLLARGDARVTVDSGGVKRFSYSDGLM